MKSQETLSITSTILKAVTFTEFFFVISNNVFDIREKNSFCKTISIASRIHICNFYILFCIFLTFQNHILCYGRSEKSSLSPHVLEKQHSVD